MLALKRPTLENAAPTVDSLRADLATAEAELIQVREAHAQAALAAEERRPGAEDERQKLRAELTAAELRIRDVSAALQAARTRDQAAAEAAERAQRETAWAEVVKHTKSRAAAARKLDEALNAFVEAYHELAEHSESLMDVCPAKRVSRHAHPAGWSRTEGAIRAALRARGLWWACEQHPTQKPKNVRQFVVDANNELLALAKD